MTAAKAASELRWVPVGAGQLALWHRPSRRSFPDIKSSGCTCVVTLLSEPEGASTLGDAARAAGIDWLWLPLPNGDTPTGASRDLLAQGIERLSASLGQGSRILLHCSAGIHRTGMVAYALLRRLGYTRTGALEQIGLMREHTRLGLQEHHLLLGDQLAPPISNSNKQ